MLDRTESYYKERFEECYINNYPKVRSFLYSYIHDYEMAKSIAQETFLVLWENRVKVDFNGEILPYLFFIARNKGLNYLKKYESGRKYSEYMKEFTTETLDIRALSHYTSTSIYTKEIGELADRAINNLNPKIKETYLLSKDKKLKHSEIAKLQNISTKTVEYRLSCALKELRKFLKDYLPFIIGVFTCVLF